MTSLSDKVARVKELDAKRLYAAQEAEANANYDCAEICREQAAEATFQFQQHSVQMAALITQLWDELEIAHMIRDEWKAEHDKVCAENQKQREHIGQQCEQIDRWKLDADFWESTSIGKDAIIQKQREVLVMARELATLAQAVSDGLVSGQQEYLRQQYTNIMNLGEDAYHTLTAIDNVMNPNTIAER